MPPSETPVLIDAVEFIDAGELVPRAELPSNW